MIYNSKGNVYYGLHIYPGVAEYAEKGKDPFRIFLNEDTLRSMDPSFAGRPVFVLHVDGVEDSVDELRGEADGWVVESFYNASDGTHWTKFLACSEKAEKAIKQGWKLSNCYAPKAFSSGGLWNGVTYAKEVTAGEYEHLAIVPNPRYQESVILTPEEFKRYNESKTEELKRLANEGVTTMALKWFKREKVENAGDLEKMVLVLPKTGRELTVPELVTTFEDTSEKLTNALTEVTTLKAKLATAEETIANAKKKNEDMDDDAVENEDDESEEAKEKKKNEAEEKKKNEEKEAEEKKKNEEACTEKKKNAKEKADRLRNADRTANDAETATVEFSDTQVARGKSRYGA